MRQAATKEKCTIVHPDWLWLSWYNFERQNEIKLLLTSQNEIPEPKKGAPPVLQMCGVRQIMISLLDLIFAKVLWRVCLLNFVLATGHIFNDSIDVLVYKQ